MDITEQHNTVLGMVRNSYEKNDEADYDVTPMIVVVDADDSVALNALAVNGNPMDYVGVVMERFPSAQIASFVSACITRDGATYEVNGETVMVVTESKTERRSTALVIERAPLPHITQEHSLTTAMMRVKMLYTEKAN